MNQLPSLERVRAALSYDPETGILTNKERRGHLPAGVVVGSQNDLGYIVLKLDRRSYKAHRIAFFIMTGEWPPRIDHEDRNPANNRWINLRAATNGENRANSPTSKTNRLGLKGVRKLNGKFQARIRHGGREHNLGVFETAALASAAYADAAVQLHGQFARIH